MLTLRLAGGEERDEQGEDEGGAGHLGIRAPRHRDAARTFSPAET